MKLRILSDLHIKYSNDLSRIEEGDEDVVVCAGDVDNDPVSSVTWLRRRFPSKRIVFVPGNHEYYDGLIDERNEQMLALGQSEGIDVLINGTVAINGQHFLGGSLWSNFQLYGGYGAPFSAQLAEKYINDFQFIAINETRRLSAWYVQHKLFAESLAFLETALQANYDKPPVVITHFAPCTQSVAAVFANDPLTPYFVNDLDALVRNSKTLWIHGHCHTAFDYRIGESRVICNPSGYRKEWTGFKPNLVVEI